MTTEEGNRIIAEFCEEGYWQIWKINGYKPYFSDKYSSMEVAQKVISESENGHLIGYAEPKFIFPEYHSDWSKLIGAVERIESDHRTHVKIIAQTCVIYDSHQTRANEYHFGETKGIIATSPLGVASSKIEAVWLAVIQFIQWYNSTSLKNNP